MISITHTAVTVMLLVVFAVALGLPSDAHAQWHRSDDIKKGFVSTKSLVLLGAATLGAVLLISQLSKSNTKAKENDLWEEKTDSTSSRSSFMHYQHKSNPVYKKSLAGVSPTTSLSPTVILDIYQYGIKGVDLLEKNLNYSNKTVVVGLSLSL